MPAIRARYFFRLYKKSADDCISRPLFYAVSPDPTFIRTIDLTLLPREKELATTWSTTGYGL